ncbi:MAG: hypothetical protein ABI480_16335 [Chitinophagaceae bacterium]
MIKALVRVAIMKRSVRQSTTKFLWVISAICIAQSAFTQTNGIKASNIFGRKYKTGETYRYKLTMEESHNGKWDHTNIAICELRVVKDSAGVPYDEVHWISRKTITGKDTIDVTSAARSVKPYRISLDTRGKIDLPAITVPDMTEPIQDFNTFFVAVSPMLGIGKLKKTGDSSLSKDPVTADFSNGSYILKGEDCIALSVKMISNTKQQVVIHSSFSPPSQACLSFLIPDMNTPVIADTINNFQMVMQAGPDKYNVQYGREYFYINSTLQKSDGKIVKAVMSNFLDLKLKINCNKDYKECQFEMPFAEQRTLVLEKL